MTGLPLPIDLAVVLLACLLVWVAFGAMFRRFSGMSRVVTADKGEELRRSRWGDGEVNGVGFENSLRVVEFTHGWLMQVHWILCGGRLWLPRTETRVGPLEQSITGYRSRELESGVNLVKLEMELADFIAEPNGAPERGRVSDS